MASYWYNPHKYFLNLDETDFFCIAPTATGRKCSYDISIEELAEANLCKANAYHMQPGPERDYELQRHVLARCCGDHHREKLGARADAARWCLEDVGILFSNMLARPDQHAPRSLRYGRQRSPLPASAMIRNYSGQLRNRLLLSPRITSRVMPPVSEIPLSPFVPVVKAPEMSINEVFWQSAASENQKGNLYGDGYVYVFSWPDHPGFVKIGYTTGSVWDRLRSWQECHSGLKCVYEERFSFPKRMERLVHLELHDRRQKIAICPSCGSTHHEWFDVSSQQAVDTIAGWSRVAQRAPIYQSYGSIYPEWFKRLAGNQYVINAAMLNELLYSEEQIKPVQLVQAALTAQAATVVTATAQAVLAAQPATVATAAIATLAPETLVSEKSSDDDVTKSVVARKALPPRTNAVVKAVQPGAAKRAGESDKQASLDEIVSVHEAVDEVLLAFSEFMGSLKIAGPEPRIEVADVISRLRQHTVPVY